MTEPAEAKRPPIRVAVAVPVHDNLATLGALHAGIIEALEVVGHPAQVIYVDDASSDGSWEWIRHAAGSTPGVRGVRLARNVGQTRAVCVGLEACSNLDAIATIDVDLDFDPADLPRMLGGVLGGADAAAGVRTARDDPWRRLAASWVFNRLLRAATGDRVGDIGCGYFAVSGDVARRLRGVGHRRLAIRPLVSALSNEVIRVPVRYRGGSGSGISTTKRAGIALEILAVEPHLGVWTAFVAVMAVCARGRCLPLRRLSTVAATVGAVGAVTLAIVHRRLSRAGVGPLGAVVESVGNPRSWIEPGSVGRRGWVDSGH